LFEYKGNGFAVTLFGNNKSGEVPVILTFWEEMIGQPLLLPSVMYNIESITLKKRILEYHIPSIVV
jgi:hypothetical protein